MSQGTHAALTPVDTTKKKSITQQLSPLLLSNSVSKSHRMEDGGLRKAGRKCGGDTL